MMMMMMMMTMMVMMVIATDGHRMVLAFHLSLPHVTTLSVLLFSGSQTEEHPRLYIIVVTIPVRMLEAGVWGWAILSQSHRK